MAAGPDIAGQPTVSDCDVAFSSMGAGGTVGAKKWDEKKEGEVKEKVAFIVVPAQVIIQSKVPSLSCSPSHLTILQGSGVGEQAKRS